MLRVELYLPLSNDSCFCLYENSISLQCILYIKGVLIESNPDRIVTATLYSCRLVSSGCKSRTKLSASGDQSRGFLMWLSEAAGYVRCLIGLIGTFLWNCLSNLLRKSMTCHKIPTLTAFKDLI